MTKRGFALLVVFAMLAAFVAPTMAMGERGYERKIVVFDKKVNEPAKQLLAERAGGYFEKSLPLIDGAVVLVPAKAEKSLKRMPGVLRVEDDVKVFALGKPSRSSGKPAPAQPSQIMPWGVDRTDAELAWSTSTAAGIKVAILDTGIDLDHPDLIANVKGGYNAIKPSRSADDDNGHGTHVAGIVAAANNSIGVVGMAPGASLYAVKVLDRNGSGWTSDIIEGIQWCIDNNIKVINMSFGYHPKYGANETLHDVIKTAHGSGIVMVAAAGNNGPEENSVNYPARFDEVIAVSATDRYDNFAYWSSSGPEVDLAAPGSEIYSTYKGAKYVTMSGTSMASPHVAGTVALTLAAPVRLDSNGNGRWDKAEVIESLLSTADDLGPTGFDNYFGYGLVDAEECATGVTRN